MDTIENRTFDEIKIGDTASLVRTLSKKDIDLFAVMSQARQRAMCRHSPLRLLKLWIMAAVLPVEELASLVPRR
jgi:hypothetical protein